MVKCQVISCEQQIKLFYKFPKNNEKQREEWTKFCGQSVEKIDKHGDGKIYFLQKNAVGIVEKWIVYIKNIQHKN